MRRNGARFGRRGASNRSPYFGMTFPQKMAALYPTHAWFEPNTNITLSVSTVSQWVDRQSGHTVTQGTAGSQPTWSATAINGKPGMGDNNGAKYLSGAAGIASMIAGTNPCTVIAYMRTRSVAAFSVLVSAGTVASTGTLFEALAQNTNVSRVNHGAVVNGALALANATNYAWGMTYAASAVNLWVNGVAEAGNPFAAVGSPAGLDVFLIGARRNVGADGSHWGGLWGDIFVIPAAISAADMLMGQDYLAAKYA